MCDQSSDPTTYDEPVCTQRDDDGCKSDPNLGTCDACGYVLHNIPRDTDTAHDELCCGSKDVCASTDLCDTHSMFDGKPIPKEPETATEYADRRIRETFGAIDRAVDPQHVLDFARRSRSRGFE